MRKQARGSSEQRTKTCACGSRRELLRKLLRKLFFQSAESQAKAYGDGRLGNVTNFKRDSAVMCLPPFTLNPKMKIPLYLRSPYNKFWAWRWRCRSWYTSSLELSHVLARREPSRDRVPRASDMTGISRKLRGSSASYGMGLGVLGHSFFISVPVTK